MNFDIIKNLIDEIYINKNNNKEVQQKLMLELTKYIGTKYYNTEVNVVFSDNTENRNDNALYYQGEKIEYFLDNFQYYFDYIDNLKNLLFIVSHELGHAHNYNQRTKAMGWLKQYHDVSNLIFARKLANDYIGPDYSLYINMKENLISSYQTLFSNYYFRNYDKISEENMASLNAIIVIKDVLLTFFPDLYKKFNLELDLQYYGYLNNLYDNNRYDTKNEVNSNIDIIFDDLNVTKGVYINNELIKREYHNNLKRKNTSFLMIELYKLIIASKIKLISFKKRDILEKRERFYIDLIVNRDMTFEERLNDIENLINYENIFYNLDWLKNLLLSWIYIEKLNKDCGYSGDEIQMLKRMIIDYLKNYEKNCKSK